jgi:hypothetical protein
MNKSIAYFSVLLDYAKELGKAEKSGNKKAIKAAKNQYDWYMEIYLAADEVIIGRVRDL